LWDARPLGVYRAAPRKRLNTPIPAPSKPTAKNTVKYAFAVITVNSPVTTSVTVSIAAIMGAMFFSFLRDSPRFAVITTVLLWYG
jgi:hypothetical protein